MGGFILTGVMVDLPENRFATTTLQTLLRRHVRLLFLVALGVGIIVFVGSWLLPPMYSSEVRLVASQGVLTPLLGNMPQVALNLDGKAFREAALSEALRWEALRRAFPELKGLPLRELEKPYRFSVRLVEGRNSFVLTLATRAPDPTQAEALARAWGEVLLDWDRARIRDGFTRYRISLEAQVKALEEQLKDPNLGAQEKMGLQTSLAMTLRDLQLSRALEVTASPQLSQLEEARLAEKVFPRPLLFGIVGGFLGGLLVLMGLVIKDGLDQTVRTAEEVHRFTQLPVLAEYPLLPPGSPVEESEAFKESSSFLRTSLTPFIINEEKKWLLLTSPNPMEGKTSIALSLGRAFARSGKRTLLIDLDLRHPLLTQRVRMFYPDLPGVEKGLEAFFDLPISLPEAFSLEKDLWIVPTVHPIEEPSESLAKEIRTLFRLLKEEPFDVIIFDAPPLIFPDAMVIAPHVSGVLLVVAEGKTQRRATEAAVEALRQIGARILGVVVNRVREGRLWKGGSYGYAHRYYRYRYPRRVRDSK